MYGPPYYTNPPDDPRADRVAEIAEQLERDWMDDPFKLKEAAEHVLGFTSYSDHIAADIARVMTGDPRDFELRAIRFMRELVGKVEEQVKSDAEEKAEEQEEREHQESEEARGDYLGRRYG